jgi:hypothetical protein
MCLIEILGAVAILVTVVSGQYSQHTVLFWSALTALVAAALIYIPANQHKRVSGQEGVLWNLGGFVFLVAFTLVVWLSVVVWI